jgi:hypothetical protein
MPKAHGIAVAGRTRALMETNRRRAAAQYAAGCLPEDQDVLRVWCPRDPAGLRTRLGEAHLAAWAEDDILHVLWQGLADLVQLAGGVQPQMWPVAGTEGLREASLRIRRLDEAIISIMVLPLGAGDLPFGRPAADTLAWRGRNVPEPQAAQPLTGAVQEHVLDSATLGAPRAVTSSARPPGPGSRPASPTVVPGRSAPRSAARTCSPGWPRSARGSSPVGYPASRGRPASVITWRPECSSPLSAARPGSGRSG